MELGHSFSVLEETHALQWLLHCFCTSLLVWATTITKLQHSWVKKHSQAPYSKLETLLHCHSAQPFDNWLLVCVSNSFNQLVATQNDILLSSLRENTTFKNYIRPQIFLFLYQPFRWLPSVLAADVSIAQRNKCNSMCTSKFGYRGHESAEVAVSLLTPLLLSRTAVQINWSFQIGEIKCKKELLKSE